MQREAHPQTAEHHGQPDQGFGKLSKAIVAEFEDIARRSGPRRGRFARNGRPRPVSISRRRRVRLDGGYRIDDNRRIGSRPRHQDEAYERGKAYSHAAAADWLSRESLAVSGIGHLSAVTPEIG